MSTENKSQGCGWSNGNLDLREEFEKGSFEELIEYCQKNELNLMHIWQNKDITEINKILRYGTALLRYFEATIDKDPKMLSVFKLGQLSGHLDCLNQILYENQQNDAVRVRFEEIKLSRPNFKTEFEDVMKIFLQEGRSIKEEEFLNMLNLNLVDLRDVLNLLTKNQFLHFYEFLGYSLSDLGIRLVKELSKLNII